LTCKVAPVGNNEEDKAKPTIDVLTSRLAEITDLATRSVAPPAMVATTPDDLDSLDLNGIAALSTPIPHKLGASAPELVSKDTTLNKKLRNCTKLANLSWERTAKSFHLPTLTENGKWLYCSPDRAGINEAMANMFANIPEALSQSTDFLRHEMDLPHHDPLVYAE
jgi:hypothetical protein